MKYSCTEISKIIINERKKLNLTQKKLGEKIGCTGKQISVFESGNIIPSFDKLLKMCEIFNCELGYILGEESYRTGCKNDTFISDETGLTIESINSIKKITAHSDERFRMFPHNGNPEKLLNKILTNECFYKLLENMSYINDLYDQMIRSQNEFDHIIDEVGEDFDKVLNLDEEEIKDTENSNELLAIKQRIDNAELRKFHDESEYERESKYYRYLIQECMTHLLDKIFPTN